MSYYQQGGHQQGFSQHPQGGQGGGQYQQQLQQQGGYYGQQYSQGQGFSQQPPQASYQHHQAQSQHSHQSYQQGYGAHQHQQASAPPHGQYGQQGGYSDYTQQQHSQHTQGQAPSYQQSYSGGAAPAAAAGGGQMITPSRSQSDHYRSSGAAPSRFDAPAPQQQQSQPQYGAIQAQVSTQSPRMHSHHAPIQPQTIGGHQGHQQQQEQQAASLYVGNLGEDFDNENMIRSMFPDARITDVRVIRDKQTRLPAGYAFIEFETYEDARNCLERYGTSYVPGTNRPIRLNWSQQNKGSQPVGGDRSSGPGPSSQQTTLHIGDLSFNAQEDELGALFRRYRSVLSVRVIRDTVTGRSKGFAFVIMSDPDEAMHAIHDLNGAMVAGRHIRVSQAHNQSAPVSGSSGGRGPPSFNPPAAQGQQQSTTVFLGGVPDDVTEDAVRHHFAPFGEITDISLLPEKRCGFVTYNSVAEADTAIRNLQGLRMGHHILRVTWGHSRNPQRSTVQAAPVAPAPATPGTIMKFMHTPHEDPKTVRNTLNDNTAYVTSFGSKFYAEVPFRCVLPYESGLDATP